MASFLQKRQYIERRLNAWCKTHVPLLRTALRACMIRGTIGLRTPEVERRWKKGLPLKERTHLPMLLSVLGLKGEGAEIGVLTGYFSEILLAYGPLKHLHSIDPWQTFKERRYDDIANTAQEDQERKYRQTVDRLRPYGERSRIHRMTSMEAAKTFADQSLDFVYIDANHSYEAVAEDIAAWWPKVKQGGILAGHDYLNGKLPEGDFGVKSAVDVFVEREGQRLFVIPARWPTWYVIKS